MSPAATPATPRPTAAFFDLDKTIIAKSSTLAFNKPFLSQRLGDGVMTMGIPVGFGVIVFTIVITAFYVQRANSQYDDLTEAIRKGVLK